MVGEEKKRTHREHGVVPIKTIGHAALILHHPPVSTPPEWNADPLELVEFLLVKPDPHPGAMQEALDKGSRCMTMTKTDTHGHRRCSELHPRAELSVRARDINTYPVMFLSAWKGSIRTLRGNQTCRA